MEKYLPQPCTIYYLLFDKVGFFLCQQLSSWEIQWSVAMILNVMHSTWINRYDSATTNWAKNHTLNYLFARLRSLNIYYQKMNKYYINGMITPGYSCQPPGEAWISPRIKTDLQTTEVNSPERNVPCGIILHGGPAYPQTLPLGSTLSNFRNFPPWS